MTPPVGAAAIAPVTIAGIFLIRCGCRDTAFLILGLTAALFAVWTFAEVRP